MATDVRVELRDSGVQAALDRLRQTLPEQGDMSPAMRSVARAMLTGTQLRFRSTRGPDGTPWPASRRAATEGGQTLSMSGDLRRSITAAHSSTTAMVGTNKVYAAIHQFGGVIRAKNGPFLAIPITPQARKARSPRNMPELRVWQTIKGQYVMGTDNGTVHFLLRRQVTMPARPFLGLSDGDRTEVLRVLQQHLDGVWKRA